MYVKGQGRIPPGSMFELWNKEDIDEVTRSGMASCAPMSTYETKVIVAAPVVAAPPFRDLYMPHAREQGEVPADGDSMLPGADVPEQGNVDPPRRKRGRPRKYLP
mgnify:FL=1